jgi:hypothetical protein
MTVLIFTHMTSWSEQTTLALSLKDSMDLVHNAFTMSDIRDLSIKYSLPNHPMELQNNMCNYILIAQCFKGDCSYYLFLCKLLMINK